MNGRRYEKKPTRPLDPASSERLAVRFSRQAERMKKDGNMLGARYRSELANFVFKNHAIPSTSQRKGLYSKAKKAIQGPLPTGKGKGYDVYPPDQTGPSILRGIAIVKSPDNYSMRFSSMEEALKYVRVSNVSEYPVRVHKKP